MVRGMCKGGARGAKVHEEYTGTSNRKNVER
jgi:hypothetical protein